MASMYKQYINKMYGDKEDQNGLNKTDITNAHVRAIYFSRPGIHPYKEVTTSTFYAESDLREKLYQERNKELLDENTNIITASKLYK